MGNLCQVLFPLSDFDAIILECHDQLSEHLTIENSPVLFGCRTGICGTCLVEVVGDVLPSQTDEKEMLEILAPNNKKARLACQIDIIGDVEITLIK